MKKILIVLALVTASVFAADCYPVEGSVGGGSGTDDLLQYDDGMAEWIWAGVNYFGTWFDITDFHPEATNFDCSSTEWWYYHHEYSPWDTDQIVVELWTGDVAKPVTELASNDIIALHNAPVIVNYPTPVSTGVNFWMIGNTTVYSDAGVPSLLYDGTSNFTGTAHSFYSQDMINWIIPEAAGIEINAFNRADGEFVTSALNSESWGAIKGLYR